MNGTLIRLGLLSIVLLVVAVISLGVGPANLSPLRVMRVLAGAEDAPSDDAPGNATTIVWDLRLPRVLLASLIGAGLAASGAGYQGLFRNPLADPFVIGASSGAALGATVAIACGMPSMTWLLALIGSLSAVGSVYVIATVGGQTPVTSLLLAGVAVNSFLAAVASLLMFLNEQQLFAIFEWLMGSIASRHWPDVWFSMPLILVGTLVLWSASRGLDALTFGEETAAALGMRIVHFRALVVTAASLTTAACVSAAGTIGFVGLIAPHAARFIVGARHVMLIPTSCLTGAILLLLADDFARTVVAPSELPVGIITAVIGGPFFIYLLKTSQRNSA